MLSDQLIQVEQLLRRKGWTLSVGMTETIVYATIFDGSKWVNTFSSPNLKALIEALAAYSEK